LFQGYFDDDPPIVAATRPMVRKTFEKPTEPQRDWSQWDRWAEAFAKVLKNSAV
jgi:hypothetical protein